MAKARRSRKPGRYVEGVELRVKSKGKNLELTFRVPWESVKESLPHTERFVERSKRVYAPRGRATTSWKKKSPTE